MYLGTVSINQNNLMTFYNFIKYWAKSRNSRFQKIPEIWCQVLKIVEIVVLHYHVPLIQNRKIGRKFRFRELLGMWCHILRIAEIMPISYAVTFSWCKIAISADTFLVPTTIFCSQEEFENSLNCGYWKNFKWSNVLFICKISWFYSI